MLRPVRSAGFPARICLTAAAVLAAIPMRASAQDLVLTNARIVDPATRIVMAGAVWIEDGRIVGTGEAAPADAPGERIDLGGKWVIPGLVDMHTHSFGNAAPDGAFDGMGTAQTAQRVTRAGVTAFLDLFGEENSLFMLRNRQREGELGGAAIFAAGPCLTATDGHCSEYGIPTRLIDTPDDARRHMAELAPKRPDVVKVVYDHFDYGPTTMPSIDRATLEALVAAAHGQGLPTVVHVGTWADVRDAVLAGADAVTHVPRDGSVPDDVVELMATRGTYHIPTLVVHTDLSEFFSHPELVEAPLLSAVSSEAVRSVYASGPETLDEPARRWVAAQEAGKAEALASVGRLHEAGVPMLTGTDAGNWGIFQGWSVHRELIRLVEAGLSPWDALAAATTTAGDFLGRDYGVSVGDEASLVVLDASPIDEIRNTQAIAMVVLRGQVAFDGR
ncbi:MAG: amidohydrolase family protein [Gemmatimonadota bacterium]|nr:amidohydrolase family protein [Gemmatimonadota bacterium]